jgi:hypothetical protein
MLATMRGVALDDDALSGAPRSSSRLRAFPGARDYRIRSLLGVLALAAVYYGAAQVGYAFEFAGPVAAIVWFPVGVGIAALYLGGLRFWPGVAIGDLLANDYSRCWSWRSCCAAWSGTARRSTASGAWGACSSPSRPAPR